MKRLLYLATLLMAASLIFAPAALAQDVEDGNLPAEIVEELVEDPQEPSAENVAEAQQEAALEEQIEAQQGTDLTLEQEAVLEPQAELEGVEPEAAAAEPKAEPKMEEKMEEKMEQPKMEEKGTEKEKMKEEKKKEIPKTGGIPINSSLIGLGAGVLLVSGGLIALKRRNS